MSEEHVHGEGMSAYVRNTAVFKDVWIVMFKDVWCLDLYMTADVMCMKGVVCVYMSLGDDRERFTAEHHLTKWTIRRGLRCHFFLECSDTSHCNEPLPKVSHIITHNTMTLEKK